MRRLMPAIGIVLTKSSLMIRRQWRRHFTPIGIWAALLRRALRTRLILPVLPRALLRRIGRRRIIGGPAPRRYGGIRRGFVAAGARRRRIARRHQRACARIDWALRLVVRLVCSEHRPGGIHRMRSLCPLARGRRRLLLLWFLLCLAKLFICECELTPLSGRRPTTSCGRRHRRPRLLNGAFLCFGDAFLRHALGCFALLANAIAEIARGLERSHRRRLRYRRSKPRRPRGSVIRGVRMIR